jgi:hypothetical protein
MSEDRKKYIVFKANIMDDDGVKRRDGDIVELTPKTAKHYGKLGYLRPYFEDGEEEEDDDDDPTGMEQATSEPVRSRRPAPKSQAAEVPKGTTEVQS